MGTGQANVSDGWNTDPFKLVFDKDTGKMFGRGSTDDKGPIMGWLRSLGGHCPWDASACT